MSSIDNRIINMQFNSEKAQASISGMSKALDTLAAKLNFKGAGKGVQSALNGLDPSALGTFNSALDATTAKFLALGTVGVTAIANLTNRVVNAGVQMAKSLTVDPIKTGFDEYELQLNSVQTILANTASKGTTLKQVNASLEELNTYADKTIYNFTNMTDAIGKFTVAGIGLEDATKAVQGFSNVAALSGANAQQAAGATQQLAQAMSSGVVKLQDWMSIENAGMAGEQFQTALKRTARNHGVAVDAMIKKTGSFRLSLQKGWLSADIMNETLGQMAGAYDTAALKSMGYTKKQIKEIKALQKAGEESATVVKTFTGLIDTLGEGVGSGWAQSWQIITGDFEESKKMWTSVSQEVGGIIGGLSDARNKMLADWKKAGGRDATIEGLAAGWNALKSIITAIAKPIQKLFPAVTGKNLASLSKGFATFMKALQPSEEVLKSFSKTVEGLLVPFSLVWDVVRGLAGFIGSMFGDAFVSVESGTLNIFKLSEAVANLLIRFREWVDNGKYIEKFFTMLTDARRNAVEPLVNFVKSLVEAFKLLIDGNVDGFIAGVKTSFGFLAPLIDQIQNGISTLAEKFEVLRQKGAGLLDGAISSATSLGETVGGTLGRVFTAIADKFEQVKGGASTLAWAFGEAGKKFTDFASKLDIGGKLDALKQSGDASGFVAAAEEQTSVLQRWVQSFKDGIASIRSFFAPFTGWLGEMFNVVSEKLKGYIADMDMDDAMGLINAGFLLVVYNAVRKFFKNLDKVVSSFTDIVDKIKDFGTGFVEALNSLTDAIKTMQANVRVNMLVKIAVAVALLAGSIWLLSKIEPKALAVGLGGVITLLAALTGVLSALVKMDAKGDMSKAVLSLIALAVAVDILATAVVKLSSLSWEELAKGLGAVIVLVGGLTVVLGQFAKMDAKGEIAKASLSLLALAVAVNILASAVVKLSGLSWEELAKGLGATGGLLFALSLFTKSVKDTDILKTAAGLAILAGALYVMAGAILLYSTFSLSTLASGLASLGATIVVLGAAMNVMPKGGKMVSAAAGMAIMSLALLGIAAALKVLSTIPLETLPVILVSLNSLIIMLTAAALLLQNSVAGAAAMLIMSGAIMGLAVALALLGQLDMATIGKGLLALAGIMLIFGAGLALLSMIAPAIAILGAAILLLGAGALAAGAGMWLFASGLAALATVGTAGIAVITGVVMGIVNLLPLIATQLGLALRAFAKVISDSGPVMVEALSVLLGSMIAALGRNGTALVQAIAKIIRQLIHEAITILGSEGPRLVQALLDILEALIVGVMEAAPRIYAAGLDMIIGFLTALESRIPEIAAKGTDVVIALINGIADNIPRLVQAGIDAMLKLIDSLAQGIRDNTERVNNAVNNLIDAVWDALTAGFANAADIGGNIIDGIKNGIVNGASRVVDAAKNMASDALNAAKNFLGIHSPSKEFEKLGKFVNQGFAKGLKSGDRAAVKAAYSAMKQDLKDLRKSTAEDVKAMEERLKKLNSARKKDQDAIKKTTKELATARSEHKAADKAYKKFTTTVAKQEKRLFSLAKSYEVTTAKLEAAREKYDEAVQARDDYQKSVIDQYSTMPDFIDTKTQTKNLEAAQTRYDAYTKSVEEAGAALAEANAKVEDSAKSIADQFKALPSIDAETTAESYINSLRKQIEATREFNEDLAVLRSMGLNDTAYQDLINKGFDAQPFIDSLIEGGETAVSEVNSLGNELANAATDLGDRTSQELYKAGADAAKSVYDGLAAKSAEEQAKLANGGGNLLTNYLTDLNEQKAATAKFSQDLATLLSMGLNKNTYEDLMAKGLDAQPFVTSLIAAGANGIKSVNDATAGLESEATKLGKAAATALYQAGVDSAKGLVKGLEAEEKDLYAQMDKLANRMVSTLKKALGIKSPSREFMAVGKFGVMGLVRGIDKHAKTAEASAAAMGENAIASLQKSMSGMDEAMLSDLDLNPTITPVLDLSAIKKEGSTLSDMLPSGAINLEGSYSSAVQLLSEFKSLREALTSAQEEAQGNTTVFNQYNSSPKALSNAEIYRRTKNQLSVAKEALSV